MKRIAHNPRDDWETRVESKGFIFHTDEGQPYWDESAYYHFTSSEIDQFEKATYALNDMCLKAVQHVIDRKLFDQFQIPERFIPWLIQSWEIEDFSLYGRFDLAYDGIHPPKLLEYNADTPTALIEAAVIQWFWMKDEFPQLDQFNSIHEKLIGAWKRAQPTIDSRIYFSSVKDHIEDFMTASYLRDTAIQAGIETGYIQIQQIGWNSRLKAFVEMNDAPLRHCFKLYPWEWMLRESFSSFLPLNTTRWLEPPWKMLLSNKAILPVLWKLFPSSPYLLPASFEPMRGSYVRKPALSREGANVTIVKNDEIVEETEGAYSGPYIYQQYFPLPEFEGNRPVIGSWFVDGYACGIGIREDQALVTGNMSRFVPHVFS